jgi:flagellar motor switch protein FliM
MTLLTDEELDTLREALGTPPVLRDAPTREVREYSLVRERADTGPAAAAIDDRSPEIAEMVETVLSTKTHRPWAVSPRAARASTVGELATMVPMPVSCSWSSLTGETIAFVLLDCQSAQRLVSCLMGINDDAAAPNEKLGALDRKVTARLFKSLGDALSEVGLRLGNDVRIDTDWRRLGVDLGKIDLVVLPLDIKEPIEARLDIVIVAAAATARSKGGAAPSVAAHIPQLDVDIVAELGQADLSVTDLLALQPGMVIPLGTTESAPLSVYVQGQRRFGAKALVNEGRICLNLTGLLRAAS